MVLKCVHYKVETSLPEAMHAQKKKKKKKKKKSHVLLNKNLSS